jgi:AraC-like DNA-binding protein
MSAGRQSQARATQRRRRDLFEAAADIIRFEYGDELTLEGVARRLYASPRQLQRAFSEAAQSGFRAFLTRVRMERARELLCESPYRVCEVAGAVGYQEPAQFAKAFRRVYGVSPSALRRRNGNGDVSALAADLDTPGGGSAALVTPRGRGP